MMTAKLSFNDLISFLHEKEKISHAFVMVARSKHNFTLQLEIDGTPTGWAVDIDYSDARIYADLEVK